MSLLFLWDEDFIAGKPGTETEMLYDDAPGEVFMFFDDNVQMLFDDV